MQRPVRAYVFLKVRPVEINEFREALSRIPEVVEGHAVTGEMDAVLVLELQDYMNLADVVKKIRTLPFVLDTQTSVVISPIKQTNNGDRKK